MITLEREQKGRAGFLMISQQFLKDEVRKIGLGPAMLYLQLLSYCYGEKEIAYPSLKTLAHSMGVTVKTIVFYRKVLVSSGLIKKITRRKGENGNYQNTIYQLVRFSSSLPEEDIDEEEPVVSEVVEEREK
ncbi:MAG: helix-turn-helix domain-containing protein, partial [Caldisericia bacterium]|nr:helix-turn-helix domain-containing protein [Caldisericia bacterium]